MKLRKFGEGSMGDEAGYSLPLIVGWLEDMTSHEDESAQLAGPKRKRINLVEDALEKLREAIEMGKEE